jgi:linoleoyl-CoA desaturase
MSPIPSEYKNKYAYYICHNTTNFSTKNKLWIWYTGGFNIQIEHHLIPFIPVDNLEKMIPIVKVLCKKYNYPYKEYPDFKTLWKDHYSYLQQLSIDKLTDAIKTEIHNKKTYQAR